MAGHWLWIAKRIPGTPTHHMDTSRAAKAARIDPEQRRQHPRRRQEPVGGEDKVVDA